MPPLPDPKEASPRIPRAHLGLATLQAGIALLALGLDVAEACGSCSRGGRLHLQIAAVGAAAYTLLLVLGLRNAWTAFYLGVYAAAGVHTALGVVMVLGGTLCPPCLAGLVVSLVLAILAIRKGGTPIALAPYAILPAFALVLGALLPKAAEASRHDAERARRVEELRAAAAPRGPGLRIDVFEMDHCPYCVEFRQRFLPRLRSDFGETLEVAFHDALRTSWVRRTPTLVLADGPVYEGLPHRYEDLREAVAAVARSRNR